MRKRCLRLASGPGSTEPLTVNGSDQNRDQSRQRASHHSMKCRIGPAAHPKATTMTRSRPLIAVYPGTFDPMTLGHEDVVRRATQLFDRVIVAVAAGHHKKAMFTLEERIDMARQMAKTYPQVEVASFSGLLRDFVVARGGKAMVRGLRAVTDFDYEFQLAGMNRSLMPEVETVFLTPSDKYQFISSTFVREAAMLGGEVDKFVSPTVQLRLSEKVRALSNS